jgi:hypothetical protein
MANYCYNHAAFTPNGSLENLELFRSAISKYRGKCIGSTEFFEILGSEAPESFDAYNEFGSRWFDLDVDDMGDLIVLSGSSAWSPVSEFFRKLCVKFNLNVESTFEEPGCDFGGYYDVSDGEVVRDKTFTYNQYQWLEGMFYESIDPDYFTEFESFDEALKQYRDVISISEPEEEIELFEFLKEMYDESRKNASENS